MTAYSIAGRVSFGPIVGVDQVTLTRSRGIQPATIQLVVWELPVLPTGSTPLFLSDGNNQYVFPDCMLQSVEADFSDGERYVITLLDYRWKWKFGEISGFYNTVVAGSIDPRTKKSPRELATLCLKEMGVTKYNVDALPNKTRPEITWDLENPAVALETLCSSLGCVVCPAIDGSVNICEQGVGKTLPNLIGGQVTDAIKAEPAPDMLYISADPTVWEVSLKLGRPVGVERDGSIKPIDELSYKPVNGWANEDPFMFSNVAIDDRKVALQSVWRYFEFEFPFNVPEFQDPVENINQIFFEDSLLEKEKVLGVERRKDAVVYGRFYDSKDAQDTNVETFSHNYEKKEYIDEKIVKRLVFDGSFTVNANKGIIEFGEPLFLYELVGDKQQYTKADVRVRTAIGIKDQKTHVRWREVLKVPTGRKNNTKPLWIRKSDVRREIIIDPKTGTTKTDGSVPLDNVDDVKAKLTEVSQYELKKLNAVKPRQGNYSGFPKIELDGTIEQVTYSISSSGFAETTASYGSEHSFVVPSFEERKRVAKLNDFIAKQQQQQNSQKDQSSR